MKQKLNDFQKKLDENTKNLVHSIIQYFNNIIKIIRSAIIVHSTRNTTRKTISYSKPLNLHVRTLGSLSWFGAACTVIDVAALGGCGACVIATKQWIPIRIYSPQTSHNYNIKYYTELWSTVNGHTAKKHTEHNILLTHNRRTLHKPNRTLCAAGVINY